MSIAFAGSWGTLTPSLSLARVAGTVIQGPDSRVFILSARHCVALPSATGLNPWSSYVAIFNYDVPCGSDEIDPAQFTQSLQVRGWSRGVARIEFAW